MSLILDHIIKDHLVLPFVLPHLLKIVCVCVVNINKPLVRVQCTENVHYGGSVEYI